MELKYDQNGLIPAIAQDIISGRVLMLAYMNEESLKLTMETGYTHYFSRSRNQLWKKGETSGHLQAVKTIRYDCDADTLLLEVEQTGNACHTGEYSCFFNNLYEAADIPTGVDMLHELYEVIQDRKVNPKEGSYTNFLYNKGIDKIVKKVGEEACEVVIAAKNGSKEEICYETADLIYHLFVLLAQQNIPLEDIYKELKSRR